MDASITAVFERCMHEAGLPVLSRGRAYKCPFHDSNTKKFYLYEDKRGWHCYSGRCPYTKGGLVQLVMAFGFADNETDVSRWLSERGLIAAPVSANCPPPAFISDFRRRYIIREDLENMSERQKEVWREAQIDLRSEIGDHYFALSRYHIASLRYEKFQRNQVEVQQARLMLDSIYAHCGKRCDCKCSFYREIQQEAA